MIIFVGVAGSGKSLQGRLLAQELKCDYLSMGEFLRQHVDPAIKQKMLTGELIDDQEVISVIDQALPPKNVNQPEFILDGFPRSVSQSEWLLSQVNAGRFNIRAVFHLNAAPEIIVPRLLERKRPDDHIEAINLRLSEYQQTIVPIIEHLEESGIKVFDIDAEQTIENVHKDIMKIISQNR